ncbi:SHOCT domain-containing protein [Streptosporangiaceae bacterium NEAU-GS5]|nr:SHOCT domain-containing protein [Streptosporangiaceae bacterium NEAU-GS5]
MIIRRGFGAPLLRGAVVGGAAYAMGRHHQAKNVQEESQRQTQRQQPQGSADELMDKLGRLAEMAQQGLLTPEEFAAAKAKLLAP